MIHISVVVPVYPHTKPLKAMQALECSAREQFEIEILIVEGTAPSVQRNAAVNIAQGEYVYFLDDDSIVDRNALGVAFAFFSAHPEVSAVGGPALTHPDASDMERCLGLVMGARLTAALTAQRHAALGEPRRVNGEGLSLCNLVVKSSVLETHDGFKAALYPSEDPEFLKRLEIRGELLFYLPSMLVYRSRRKTLAAAVSQFFRYGQGRANHIFSNLHLRDLVFFGPSVLFLVFIAACLDPAGNAKFVVCSYAALAGSAALFLSRRAKEPLALAMRLWLVILLVHGAYGAGFLVGLIVKLRKYQGGSPIKISRYTLPASSAHASFERVIENSVCN
ncbi:MAG: glycosyltransferase [Deltaproteobacteria bacterium]|nr:glycosyltransferase [Deltaproteobacteria bacterium]